MIELVPGDLTEHVETEIANDAIKNRTQPIEICKRSGVASACVDEPFGSERHRTIARENKVKTQLEQVRKRIEQVRKRGLPPLLDKLVQKRGQAPLPDLFYS